jgi:antirestriction protein ArdC
VTTLAAPPPEGDSSGRLVLREVTARIVEELKAGAVPWVRPWRDEQALSRPYNAFTRLRYRAFNSLALWQAAKERGFQHGG